MKQEQHLKQALAKTDDPANLALFRLDYQRLVNMLLPFTLRKHGLQVPFIERRHTMLAWIHALLAPVKRLYIDFLVYRYQINYKMEHTGQVVYLEKVLNDRFDRGKERIRIKDGPKLEWVYIFRRDEQKPKYLKTIYLYNQLSYGEKGVDFEVFIPTDTDIPVWTDSGKWAECHSLLNYYKLAGKTYQLTKP